MCSYFSVADVCKLRRSILLPNCFTVLAQSWEVLTAFMTSPSRCSFDFPVTGTEFCAFQTTRINLLHAEGGTVYPLIKFLYLLFCKLLLGRVQCNCSWLRQSIAAVRLGHSDTFWVANHSFVPQTRVFLCVSLGIVGGRARQGP